MSFPQWKMIGAFIGERETFEVVEGVVDVRGKIYLAIIIITSRNPINPFGVGSS